jgi:diguanylate cyclase (GGDEF)-like protein
VSRDGDLIARLSVEAVAAGFALATHDHPSSITPVADPGTSSVIIDDESTRPPALTELLRTVARLATDSLVVVLTERDALETRVELARAGASGVLSRSESARRVVSFVEEALARRRPGPSTVVALNARPDLEATLRRALRPPDCRLLVRNDPVAFWETLDEQGADLVIASADGVPVTGMDLCQAIRAHPRWHHLPVVVIGDGTPAELAEAMDVGADDYLDTEGTIAELSIRIGHQLGAGRLIRARCDIDPLTRTENRASVERSLEHLLRLATRRTEPMALALVTIDHLDQIREDEGNATGDLLIRQLGDRLTDACHPEDVIGRWSDDGFAIGMYGSGSGDAAERMKGLLGSFAAERIPSTTGRITRHTFSAGIASSPTDASTFHSLERLAGSALYRGRAERIHVVCAGGVPPEPARRDVEVDVVLVEDDDSFADVIEHALSLRHYPFLRFSDGADAAAALGSRTVRGRVVLLDIGLPSLDGFGVLKEMRHQGALADTRVIMLTARSSEAETLRALGLGATEHLAKPLSIPVLLGRLDETRFRSVA